MSELTSGNGENKRKTTRFYTIVAVTMALMCLFGFLPPFGQITPDGMKVLGVFIGCIFAWSMGELLWPSILALVILALQGSGTVAGNYATAFGNQMSALIIASLVICFAIERCGLLTEIAKWVITRKFAQRNLWNLALAFFITAAVGGALMSNSLPPTIILWALFYETARHLGLKPYERFTSIVLIGIVVIGYSGSTIMPYSMMGALSISLSKTMDPAFMINNLYYIGVNLALNIVFIPMAYLFLRFVLRPSVNVEMIQREPHRIVFTKRMKWVALYLILLIVVMVVPNLLPAGNSINTFFAVKLGNIGVLITLPVLMMLTRTEGESIVDIGEALSKGIPWGLVLLVSAAMTVGGAITAEATGIMPTIVAGLSPILAGKSAAMVVIIFCIVGLVVTNAVNDLVTITVLLPIAYNFVVEAGGNPIFLTAMMAPACVQGCFLPSGSVLGALMHGNGEWLKSKDVYKYVFLLEAVLAVAFTIFNIIYTNVTHY
ncbi:MAG: hypothetical protein LBH21_05975 [Gracilibacteraceae bacterium]|jgi:sodium-dependent dicarboxylate transporter 2/3/5|nr:hypothetical protein [Gracilibacteraceae bacterium]